MTTSIAVHRLASVCLALMTGNEICVAAFVEPTLRTLRERVQVEAVPGFTAALGRFMPFWYALSLVLAAVDAWLHWKSRAEGTAPVLAAFLLQIAILAITISMLVPINNRLSRMREAYPGWLGDARRWDALHRIRVVLLVIAVALMAAA